MLGPLFDQLDLPAGRIFFLHARLRNIRQHFPERSYTQLAGEIIERLWAFKPKTILVPAYTIYAFLHGGVFHRLFSKCETGRFSEEVYQLCAAWRSPDPMYSVFDLGSYLQARDGLDYTRTFGAGSLFEHLYRENEIVLNLDLPGVWSTHFHQAEIAQQVPYRFPRQLDGVIYHDHRRWERVSYHAYLRRTNADGGSYPPYHRENTKRYLLQQGVLRQASHAGIEIGWCEAQSLVAAVDAALTKDKTFLIVK